MEMVIHMCRPPAHDTAEQADGTGVWGGDGTEQFIMADGRRREAQMSWVIVTATHGWEESDAVAIAHAIFGEGEFLVDGGEGR